METLCRSVFIPRTVDIPRTRYCPFRFSVGSETNKFYPIVHFVISKSIVEIGQARLVEGQARLGEGQMLLGVAFASDFK